MIAVKDWGASLQYLSKALRNDPEIVIEAIKNRESSYIYAGKEIKEKYPLLKDFKESFNKKTKSNEVKKEKATRSRARTKGNER